MNSRPNRYTSRNRDEEAERRAQLAAREASHATEWLTQATSDDSQPATIPWLYDLNEAKQHLLRAVSDIDRAIQIVEKGV